MFIILPTRMNYETQRFPIVTLSLIGINTLVYVVTLICFFNTDGNSDLWILQNLWLIPAKSYWWMYLTSMFVHAGFFHLAGNMIFLFLFGCVVEDLIGRVKYALMYLVGGLAAEFTYIAFSPEHFSSTVPMGGASGAISACMGMYLLLRGGDEIEFKYFFWFFMVRAGEFEIAAWIGIVFWFLSALMGMILAMFSHEHGGVAFGAHVGGLLAGCAMIGIYKLFTRPKKEEGQTTALKLNLMIPRPQPAMATAPAVQTETMQPETQEVPTIYIAHDGQQSGPFTVSQVQAMVRLGSIEQAALYWTEGMADWQSIAEFTG